jgi:hypothetical protein
VRGIARRLVAWGLIGAVIPAIALLPSPVATAGDDAQFRTPSGAIGCGYYDGVLRCDVAGGVVPLPPRPRSCELDWGQGFNVRAHGAATVVCAGDTALDPHAPVVRYGTTLRRGGIACSSSPNGLHCTNADRHGFFISRGEAYRF